jgi:anti-anti-sigma regulatory factor
VGIVTRKATLPEDVLMHERQLEVFRSRLDGSEVIQCNGWVDTDTCGDLQRVLDAAFEHGVRRLRLDLTNVRGIDEAGIDCVLQAAQRCREVGAILELESGDVVQAALRMSAEQLSG